MRIRFVPEAQREFEESERYYERQVPGLGRRFREDVREALCRLQAWPLACAVERGDIRRLTLLRFPFKLLYSIEPDHLLVLAVAHGHRAPGCWAGRQDELGG